ncbi:MAG TPA: RNA-binding cell elongation regulator Jag/EloR, partial [Thermomicrobiales bacterium]|nr:RNA-binding cell elongation regulator Jag/EloR [Thermomicrobiales bacterium]
YSVDEAVRLALEQLGLGKDAVDIEILSDAGPDEGDEALVRVTAKGMASQPTPRGGRAPGGRPPAARPGSGAPRRAPGARRVPGDRPSSRGAPPRADGARAAERVAEGDEQVAKDVVRELLERMGIDADVVAVDNPSSMPLDADEPPTIFIDILGHDLGILIGRRGDHLAQLQDLVNLLVSRKLGAYTRVVLDVEGYRSRREESLIGLAERVARQVARSRRPIQLEPMPPNERRIVHLSLRENPEVTTVSHGEGSLRRVTVQPRE